MSDVESLAGRIKSSIDTLASVAQQEGGKPIWRGNINIRVLSGLMMNHADFQPAVSFSIASPGMDLNSDPFDPLFGLRVASFKMTSLKGDEQTTLNLLFLPDQPPQFRTYIDTLSPSGRVVAKVPNQNEVIDSPVVLAHIDHILAILPTYQIAPDGQLINRETASLIEGLSQKVSLLAFDCTFDANKPHLTPHPTKVEVTEGTRIPAMDIYHALNLPPEDQPHVVFWKDCSMVKVIDVTTYDKEGRMRSSELVISAFLDSEASDGLLGREYILVLDKDPIPRYQQINIKVDANLVTTPPSFKKIGYRPEPASMQQLRGFNNLLNKAISGHFSQRVEQRLLH